MAIYINVICCIIFCGLSINCQNSGIFTDVLRDVDNNIDSYRDGYIVPLNRELTADEVELKLYYECMCPGCRAFDTMRLAPVLQKLGQHLDIHTYPYGFAKTIDINGELQFHCQHGPKECYGNKLHACSLDIIPNRVSAVLFNACMMERRQGADGSNDVAADDCGNRMRINAKPIKECANSEKGSLLLNYYGEESRKLNLAYVPYFLINGKPNDGGNLMHDVCAAFVKPPPQCQEYLI